MPSQHRKHRGYRSQKVVANYLVEHGFPFAESTGAGRPGTIKQLKDRSDGKDLPVAVLRLNGQGEASIGEWVTILRLEDFVNLLRAAGYGDPVETA